MIPQLGLKRKFSKKILVVLVIVVVLIVGIVVALRHGRFEPFANISYARVDALIADRVSKSAHINVSLPTESDFTNAQARLAIIPEIPGTWNQKNSTTFIFTPSEKLKVGKHYLLTFDTAGGKIGKEFFVDEDPQVEVIIPTSDSEANEHSTITIMFNRPMVPLSTLDTQEAITVSVDISPATAGRFKWISTRSLQFQPTHQLLRSSNYTVTLREGMTSVEGLPVPAITHTFRTRPLRIESSSKDTLSYGSPFVVRFNQDVDLAKTKSSTHLRDAQGRDIAFNMVYQKERINGHMVEQPSAIEIRPRVNSLGIANQWDALGSYQLNIDAAIPTIGNIPAQPFQASVAVSDVIESVDAASTRSNYVRQDFFDPSGTAVFRFYSDIDLAGTSITGKGILDVRYGTQCKNSEGENFSEEKTASPKNCAKETIRSQAVISFNPAVFSPGEQFDVIINKLTNTEGDVLISRPMAKTFTVYPRLTLHTTDPAPQAQDASNTKLVLCTSTPLQPATAENYQSALSANGPLLFKYWNESYRRENYGGSDNEPCEPGQFVTTVSYGLYPLTNYRLSMNLKDAFGQTLPSSVAFKTQAQSPETMRFFSLQKYYTVTQSDKTVLTYAAQNFDYVEMEICKVKPEQFLRLLTDSGAVRSGDNASLPCTERTSKRISLPLAYWKNQYFTVDLKSHFKDVRGQYVVSFTHPNYTVNKVQQYERNLVSVTNLAVAQKVVMSSTNAGTDTKVADIVNSSPSKGTLYWVTRVGSMEPVADSAVEVFSKPDRQSDPTSAATLKTDRNGIAIGQLLTDVVGAVVTKNQDTAVISSQNDTLNYANEAWGQHMIYTYTDRPIYQPGHEVFIKGIYRWTFDGQQKLLQNVRVPIEVFDSRQESIYKTEVMVNDYGTFSTSLQLKADAPLGDYRISAFGGSDRYFSVEEYVAAAFEATIATNGDEFVAGDTLSATLNARYYFGVPLASGNVSYQFTSQDYYFDRYQGKEYYDFGQGWYYCYDCAYDDQFILEGTGTINAHGVFKLSQALTKDKFFKSNEQSKIVVLHMTATDTQGRAVSTVKSFIVHRGQFYLGIAGDSYVGENQPAMIKIKSVDTKGVPRAVSALTITVNKVNWQYFRRQEVDGGYYYTYERKLAPVQTLAGSTDSQGNGSQSITVAGAGEYEINVSGRDSRGNKVSATSPLYVYGRNQVDIKPTNDNSLELQTKTLDVDIGDTVDVILKSTYRNAKALVSLERGTINSYEIVPITGNIQKYSFKVREEHLPNIYLTVLLIAPDPNVKFGMLAFNVDRTQKNLNVKIKSSKDTYLPGEKVDLEVMTSDYQHKAVPAELSVAVADTSVLALKGNPHKNPVDFFYKPQPLAVSTVSNIRNILEKVDIPADATKGGAGGGAESPDLAKKKRGEFKDTAYWLPAILTDDSGKAKLSFKLPDNLTRWQVESVGITKDTKVGAGYGEFVARKDVMATPIQPRFVIPGDKFKIGVKVFNQTKTSQRLTVSITSDTLSLTSPAQTYSRSIPSGKDQTVYFDAIAPLEVATGVHHYTISAKNETYEDTVDGSISITPTDAYEYTATSNFTSQKESSEYIFLPQTVIADKGELKIKANATLAVYLSDALQYMAQFPYGCSEQLASKLSALAIIERGLDVKNVDETFKLEVADTNGQKHSAHDAIRAGLKQIYANQNESGGFSYYAGLKPNLQLTIHVLNALQNIKDAGYDVRKDVMNSAADYLVGTLRQMLAQEGKESLYATNTLIVGVYALERTGHGNKDLRKAIEDRVSAAVLNEKLSTQGVAYLAILSRKGFSSSLKRQAYNALQNRIEIDARGAFARENPTNTFREYYETPITNTALALKAFVADKDLNPMTGNMIRWLVASRDRNGAWGSTNSTLAVVDAFTDFLKWTGETKAKFNLQLQLDHQDLTTFAFNSKNVFEPMRYTVPVNDISKGSMHTIDFKKVSGNTGANLYYDVELKYYLPVEKLKAREEGISIERKITAAKGKNPVASAKVGDILKGHLTITTAKPRILFGLEDMIPAGTELINFDLATSDQTLVAEGTFYPDFKEVHRDRLFLFSENLPAGTYTYDYYMRVTVPGTFNYLPATARELYFPENFGRTGGSLFTVTQ